MMTGRHQEDEDTIRRIVRDEDTIRRIVREEVQAGIDTGFARLGLDTDDWQAVQRDVQFLRHQRRLVEKGKMAVLWGGLTSVAGGLVAALAKFGGRG